MSAGTLLLKSYYIALAVVYGYYIFVYLFKKIYKKEFCPKISKFIIITIFTHISVTIYVILVCFIRADIYRYMDPVKIAILLNGLLILIHLLINFRFPVLYAIILVSIFSQYLDAIPRYPQTDTHITQYQWYQDLHSQNNTRIDNQITIVTPMFLSNDQAFFMQEFTKATEIIDPDVTLSFTN